MKRGLLLVFITVLLMSLTGCSRAIWAKWLDYQGDVEEMVITEDANYRLQTYDWFHKQYGIIKASIYNLETLPEEYRNSTYRGINLQIEEYNSKARQKWSSAKWLDNTLPKSLSFVDGILIETY